MFSSTLLGAAVDSIQHSLSQICEVDDRHYSWDCPRKFSGFARRLQLVLNQLLRSSSPPPENLPPSVHTSLKGIAGDLSKALETLSVYATKSKIYVLIHCVSLCASLQEHTIAIGGWLALLDSALHHSAELRKKIKDLSAYMKQAHLRVTENEERVQRTLQREGEGKQTSKAVQSAIIMDLARALGIDSNNHHDLCEQVKLLKTDLAHSNLVSERRILISLEKIVDNWLIEPDTFMQNTDADFEDHAHISPFKNFVCPLTKEVMRDPVVLESSQTYERASIEYWFERCLEDGRDPTCPVTGQVLKSLELKPNIGLAGAIEEWVNRNIDVQIKAAVQCLREDSPSVDSIERGVKTIYNISEEHPYCRYRIRTAGIVVLIIKVLRNCSKSVGSHLRSKALKALLSMANDEESKGIMLEEGMSRLAIHGLTGSSETEREYAVRLLLEFATDEAYCMKLASEKGALVLLTSMENNLEHPALSHLAEEVLTQMENVEANIEPLAAAGRFGPLLCRLCEGPDDVKIQMASLVGEMTLTNSCKEQIARRSAKTLVEMLSMPEGRNASLQALRNLSSLDDNAAIFVDSAVLPALTDILFANQDASAGQKEFAASILANVLATPGHWELSVADKSGHFMQSEIVVLNLLGLLSLSSSQCQMYCLQILYNIASSPQASDTAEFNSENKEHQEAGAQNALNFAMIAESVSTHIRTGNGLKSIITFLEHPGAEHRIAAFRLSKFLSVRLGADLVNELKIANKLSLFKNKILDNQSTDSERSDAACILANLPLSENEVKTILGDGFLSWTVATLKDQQHCLNERFSRPMSNMVEGLLGILLQFIRINDLQSLSIINEHHLMTMFREQLVLTTNSRVKQLVGLGLKYLSEFGRIVSAGENFKPTPCHGFCASLVFMCGKPTPSPSTCPFHNAPCEQDSQLCLSKSNCIKPLVDHLRDEETSVQIVALEALSTLVLDTEDTSNSKKRAVDELEQRGVVDAVIELFVEARPGQLQEKAIWMVERLLRSETVVHKHALNQSLVRALAEAFRHGNAVTRKHAQDSLTNLKEISGVSGNTSSQSRGRR